MQTGIQDMGLEEFIQNFVVDLPFKVIWPPRPLQQQVQAEMQQVQAETNSTEEDSTGEKGPLLNGSHYSPTSI